MFSNLFLNNIRTKEKSKSNFIILYELKEKCNNKILSCDTLIALNAYIINKKKKEEIWACLTRNLKWKSNFGEIKVVDLKTNEETSKYEKSW